MMQLVFVGSMLSSSALCMFHTFGSGIPGVPKLPFPGSGNTMRQVDSSTECKLKCGGEAGCEVGRKDHAAGTVPAEHADRWAWCSGIASAAVPNTSKEKFGTACCPIEGAPASASPAGAAFSSGFVTPTDQEAKELRAAKDRAKAKGQKL